MTPRHPKTGSRLPRALAAPLCVWGAVASAQSATALAPPATALYDHAGRAVAYLRGETIHLWAGQPVAYVLRIEPDRYEVYRFGGRHIGWLTGGILRDSAGDGVCAVRSMVGNPQPEPPKPQPPQAEPPRILRDPAPRPPAFSREWSHTDCETFLAAER